MCSCEQQQHKNFYPPPQVSAYTCIYHTYKYTFTVIALFFHRFILWTNKPVSLICVGCHRILASTFFAHASIFGDVYKFPIVKEMKTAAYHTVSRCLGKIFIFLGFPEHIKTDNRPPWDSNDLVDFFKARNIRHITSIHCGQEVMAKLYIS